MLRQVWEEQVEASDWGMRENTERGRWESYHLGGSQHLVHCRAHKWCWRTPVIARTHGGYKPYLTPSYLLCFAVRSALIRHPNTDWSSPGMEGLFLGASLALSPTLLPLSSLSVSHSSDLNSRQFLFFFCLALVCLQADIFSVEALPAVWFGSSEELVNQSQHSHKNESGVMRNVGWNTHHVLQRNEGLHLN